MKAFLFGIILILSAAFYSPTYYSIGQRITSPDSMVSHEIQFYNLPGGGSNQLIYILIDPDNSGEIAFSVGSPADSNDYFFEGGDKVPISIVNGLYNLNYIASDSGQHFVVTN